MATGQKSLLTGIAAGVVVVLLVTPVGYVLWKRASSERAQMLSALSAIDGKLAKTDTAVAAMQKTASVSGVTRQLDELNGRIKSANEALAGVQKASKPQAAAIIAISGVRASRVAMHNAVSPRASRSLTRLLTGMRYCR